MWLRQTEYNVLQCNRKYTHPCSCQVRAKNVIIKHTATGKDNYKYIKHTELTYHGHTTCRTYI